MQEVMYPPEFRCPVRPEREGVVVRLVGELTGTEALATVHSAEGDQ